MWRLPGATGHSCWSSAWDSIDRGGKLVVTLRATAPLLECSPMCSRTDQVTRLPCLCGRGLGQCEEFCTRRALRNSGNGATNASRSSTNHQWVRGEQRRRRARVRDLGRWIDPERCPRLCDDSSECSLWCAPRTTLQPGFRIDLSSGYQALKKNGGVTAASVVGRSPADHGESLN